MMNDLFIYLGLALVFSFIGVYIGKLLAKLSFEKEKNDLVNQTSILKEKVATLLETKEEHENEISNFLKEKEAFIKENSNLESKITFLKAKLDEQKEDVEKLQEKFTKDFELLANKIFEDKSSKFTNQNKENIKDILEPLKEKIEKFEKKVTDTQEKNVGMHSALKEQLDQIKDLNTQMSKEANNLTKALKGDSKTQGDWGETQLELLLEKANLTKNIHFTTQGGYRDEEID